MIAEDVEGDVEGEVVASSFLYSVFSIEVVQASSRLVELGLNEGKKGNLRRWSRNNSRSE